MSRPVGKPRAAKPVKEKSGPSKSIDLSLKGDAAPLAALPSNFRDETDDLRKLNLSGQTRLGKELSSIRFAGETLTWLNLSGVDCSQVAACLWLKMLKTLFVLNMSHCQLEALPKEIATVSSLKALVASHNQLTSPSLAHLSGLSDLNSLILSDNQLTSLPSSISSLKSLKKLSLANNKLRSDSLPSFASLKAIEEIRLNGNSGISAVPDGLADLPSLSLLELSNTTISEWSEIDKLKACTSLVNLGLKGTSLANQSGYKIKVTKTLPKLRILDNDRFDPKFLQRKEKLKAKQAGEAGDEAPQPVEGKQNPNLKETKVASEQPLPPSAKKLGKRKAVEPEEEDGGSPAVDDATEVKKNKAKKPKEDEERPEEDEERPEEDEAAVLSDDEGDSERARAALLIPRNKRNGYQRRLAKMAKAADAKRANGAVPAQAAAARSSATKEKGSTKSAKQVGGSLSAPTEEVQKAEQPDVPEDLVKARSSVLGIVETDKGAKKGKKDRQSKASASDKPDVLALLQQSQTASSIVNGWD